MKKLFIFGIILLILLPLALAQADGGSGTSPATPPNTIEICTTEGRCAMANPTIFLSFGTWKANYNTGSTAPIPTFTVTEKEGAYIYCTFGGVGH